MDACRGYRDNCRGYRDTRRDYRDAYRDIRSFTGAGASSIRSISPDA